jgi:ELWxxDGT repeat protein
MIHLNYTKVLAIVFILFNLMEGFSQTADRLSDIYLGSQNGVSVTSKGIYSVGDSVVIFPGFTFETGGELFKTNGTTSGTGLVKDIYEGQGSCWTSNNGLDFYTNGNKMFFPAREIGDGVELWVTDGSESGTIKLKDFNPGVSNSSFPNSFVSPDNRKIFFRGTVQGINGRVCVTDGTSNGSFLTEIGASNLPNIYLNGFYYYTSPSLISGLNNTINKLDTATLASSFVLDTDPENQGGDPKLITTYGDSIILYTAFDDSIHHFYTFNVNTNSVSQLPEFGVDNPQLIAPNYFFRIPNSNKVLFAVMDETVGREIWVCDGAEVRLLKDIEVGLGDSNLNANPYFYSLNNTVYFTAFRSGNGVEMFKTDGTSAGTEIAFDFVDWGSYGCQRIISGAGVLIGGRPEVIGSSRYALHFWNGSSFLPLMSSEGEELTVDIPTNNIPELWGTEMNGEFYFVASTPIYGKEIFKMNSLLTHANFVNRKAITIIYPNPSNGFINLNLNYKSVSIYDVYGKNVFERYDCNGNLDFSCLQDGLYIVKTIDLNNTITEQKLIIKK